MGKGKQNEFECKECGTKFNDQIHLERHVKFAHQRPKHDGFVQKWYWEN